MGLQQFLLAGHSFGGYVSGNYTLKHPQRVQRLLLLSPLGIRVKPEGEDDWQRFQAKSDQVKKQGGSPPPAFLKLMIKSLWNVKVSPISFARVLGLHQTKKLIDDYMSRRVNAQGNIEMMHTMG